MPATKTARSAATFTKLAPAVHLIEALVVLPPAYRGGDPRPRKVTLRLDGREPEGWHVDLCDLGLWETILPLTADGRQPFPTRRAAEKHARAWIRAAREQAERGHHRPAPDRVREHERRGFRRRSPSS